MGLGREEQIFNNRLSVVNVQNEGAVATPLPQFCSTGSGHRSVYDNSMYIYFCIKSWRGKCKSYT